MELIIDLVQVTPRVDYVYGRTLTREQTAVEAAQALNFKVKSRRVEAGVLHLAAEHGGAPAVCALWAGDLLGCLVRLVR